jgi:hypothetical protein
MFVEPLADIPAHRNHATHTVLFNVVDCVTHHFTGETVPASFGIRKGVSKRNTLRLQDIVERTDQRTVDPQFVSPFISVMDQFAGHLSMLNANRTLHADP